MHVYPPDATTKEFFGFDEMVDFFVLREFGLGDGSQKD